MDAWPPRADLALLNHELPRVDGPAKVSGRARYTHDVRLPDMLYARVLCCPLPCAEVTLDLEPARKIKGVEAVIELATGKTGYLGQPVAAVAARTPELAEDGLRAIVLKLTPKPWAVDHAQATADGAPKAGRNGNVSKDNVSGDEAEASAAIAAADAVVEATYTLPVQHHACLETHGVVVDYRGGDEATVYCSTQGTFTVLDDAPGALGLKASKVTAIVEHMGGGFGSKFGIGIEGKAACMLSKQLGKPVHLMLERADEFVTAGNRSGEDGPPCNLLRHGRFSHGFLPGISGVKNPCRRHGGHGRGRATPAAAVSAVRQLWLRSSPEDRRSSRRLAGRCAPPWPGR